MAGGESESGDAQVMKLAWSHFAAQRFDLAEELGHRAIGERADDHDAANLLAFVAYRTGRAGEAIGWMERAIESNPRMPAFHANLCEMYRRAGEPERAAEAGRRALALDPLHVLALNNLGAALLATGDVRGALDCLTRQVEINPKNPVFHLRRAMLRMLLGDVDGGLAEYEWRLAVPEARPQGRAALRPAAPPGQMWRGEPVVGKKLFFWSEQGLGDAIHCMRFFPALMAQGPLRLAGKLPPKLAPLIALNFPYVTILPQDAEPEAADHHFELMSLLRLVGRGRFRTETGAPYLHAPAAQVEGFRRFFSQYPGLRIGLVWSGNSNHRDDARRSMPGRELLPLLDVEGCHFFSLQIGARPDDAALFGAGVIDLSREVSNMTATASAIAALDLVIGVDTSLIHLAGALGTPVWTMLAEVPDWRWGLGTISTPLYRSMRLFRQQRGGDWPGVIRDVRAALTRAAASGLAASGGHAGGGKAS